MILLNNKKILLAIAMALVLSLSIGMTFAYFSNYAVAKGNAKISLVGKTEIVEKVDNASKEIVIKNIGETDVLVRVAVFGPPETIVSAGVDWVKDGDFYYYKKILPAGKSMPDVAASKITASIKGPAGTVDNFDVVVVNECVPVTYDEGNKIHIPDDWAQGFLSSN